MRVGVRFAARQARLQHHAGVAVALLPHRLEDIERDGGVGRVLHVDAHEELLRGGGVKDAAEVVDAGGAIDGQAELGQLQRDVAFDARGGDALEHAEVGAGRGIGFGDRGDALAEVIEGRRQAGGLDDAAGVDRLVDGLAGDETPRESAAAAHAVSRRELFEGRAAGEKVEERFCSRLEHQ